MHNTFYGTFHFRLIETLSILKSKYKEVFFIPGNHELWINKSDISPNSLVKLFEIVRHCDQIGELFYLSTEFPLHPSTFILTFRDSKKWSASKNIVKAYLVKRVIHHLSVASIIVGVIEWCHLMMSCK